MCDRWCTQRGYSRRGCGRKLQEHRGEELAQGRHHEHFDSDSIVDGTFVED